jgi:HlyD family secretion protein
MLNKIRLFFYVALIGGVSLWILHKVTTPYTKRVVEVERDNVLTTHQEAGISAYGYLEPAGNTRLLGAPILSQDGGPRIKRLFVEEGQAVKLSQKVAIFDTIERLISQQETIKARVAYLKAQVMLLESETNRYKKLSTNGAIAASDLESRQLNLLKLRSELELAKKDLDQNHTEQNYSTLFSPIDGTVIQIYRRSGERVGAEGVMRIGQIQIMEAVAQVNENDIKSVQIGQAVELSSQNGGFARKLFGTVIRISPGVTNKKLLTLNPGADADNDTRSIDVRVRIRPDDSDYVKNLTGVKITAKFLK